MPARCAKACRPCATEPASRARCQGRAFGDSVDASYLIAAYAFLERAD